MHVLTLFYDAHCGVCSRFRRWMLEQPAYVRLNFVPYDSPQALRLCPDLRHLRADEEIVVMGDDGSLWQGAAAWVTCLWALRDYREWSLRLATPGMLGLARKVVHWISSNRISLSALLRLKGDDALRAEVGAVACENGACALKP
ncbi:thiol-disulfide oxidoreductase DCC family protein [Prosthecobacter sp.]|uniref:thiol-disulfide oxidoreductase DCC family protein n=1 Tax=Prosthecobacter sp. TaxID=1965333 RepID=UPI0037833B22